MPELNTSDNFEAACDELCRAISQLAAELALLHRLLGAEEPLFYVWEELSDGRKRSAASGS